MTSPIERQDMLSKQELRRLLTLRIWKAGSLLLYAGLFALCWMLFFVPQMADRYYWRGNLAVVVVYTAVLFLLIRIYRGYDLGNLSRQDLFASHALAQVLCNIGVYGLFFFLYEHFVSPLPLVGLHLCEMLVMYLWAGTANAIYWRLTPKERVVVLYRSEADLSRLEHLEDFFQRFEVVDTQLVERYEPALMGQFADVDTVIIVGVEATARNGILKDCLDMGLRAYVLPKVGDLLMRGASMQVIAGELLLRVNRPTPNPEYLLAKRCMDIVASLCGLVLTSPILLVTALAIKLQDGGPVLYRQIRLTRDRQAFEIWKFRSMRVDAEGDGKARLAGENDDRITPVGRFIRTCRIDELPQLVNILKGDMTLVGPRPERPEIAAQYEEFLPAFALRTQVKAGLTGYAQIYGRYNSEPYEKLQMDLVYINRMSMTEDLRLLFATLRILFQKESTQGIETGQSTAERHETPEEQR